MKTEGLILVGVLTACVLVGVGVGKAVVPAVSRAVQSEKETSRDQEELAASKLMLGKDLRAGYRENIVITDEILDQLVCTEEGSSQETDCYNGPTKEKTYYGKANVTLKGKTQYVQLTSSPNAAYLETLGNPR